MLREDINAKLAQNPTAISGITFADQLHASRFMRSVRGAHRSD